MRQKQCGPSSPGRDSRAIDKDTDAFFLPQDGVDCNQLAANGMVQTIKRLEKFTGHHARLLSIAADCFMREALPIAPRFVLCLDVFKSRVAQGVRP